MTNDLLKRALEAARRSPGLTTKVREILKLKRIMAGPGAVVDEKTGGIILNVDVPSQWIHSPQYQQARQKCSALLDDVASRIAAEGEDPNEVAIWLSYNCHRVVQKLRVSATKGDAAKVIAYTVIMGVSALLAHLWYGPFFIKSLLLDRTLFVCFGLLLGEYSARILWLERSKRKGILPVETLRLMEYSSNRLLFFGVGGYILFKVLGGTGKGLMLSLIFLFGLIRWDLNRIFRTIKFDDMRAKEEALVYETGIENMDGTMPAHSAGADGEYIARLMLRELKERLSEKGLVLDLKEAAIALLARLEYNEKYDARALRRVIEQNIENPLDDMLWRGEVWKGHIISLDSDGNEFVIRRIGGPTE